MSEALQRSDKGHAEDESNERADAPTPILQARNLRRIYRMGEKLLPVLDGVDLDVPEGQWLGILGRSGSGKSTLLHLLGGLDRPSSGQLIYAGRDIASLRGAALDRYRSREVGFVFQAYHLLPELSALENVRLAAKIGGGDPAQARPWLERVGLGDRLKHRPSRLSGGERQRVAIARALVNKPALLLADEPTGNLDAQTGRSIIDLIRDLHTEGQTIVMVTHDTAIAAEADEVVTIHGGRVVANAQTAPADDQIARFGAMR